MRIAYVLTSLANVGPVIVVKDLVESLPPECEVAIFYFDDIVEISFNRDVSIKKIGFFDGIDLSKFDVVHSHMMRADFFGFVNRRKIRRLVSTMHSDFKKDLRLSHGRLIAFAFSWLWICALKKYDHIAFLTQSQMNLYPQLSAHGSVIYNGRNVDVDSDSLLRIDDLTYKSPIVLGACAHIVKRKGFEQIIDFLADFGQGNYMFVLYGSGPALESLRNYAESRGVGQYFVTPGPTNDVISAISEFDIYVMSSYSEGMPLALLEAAACGCPIVTSDLPVIKEVFSDDEVSFYSLSNIKSLSSAVKSAVSCGERYSRLAKARYLVNYTPKVMAEKYNSIYY